MFSCHNLLFLYALKATYTNVSCCKCLACEVLNVTAIFTLKNTLMIFLMTITCITLMCIVAYVYCDNSIHNFKTMYD